MSNFGTRTAKTGGGSAAADGIAYNNLEDDDKLLIMDDGECSPYLFDDSLSDTESVPEFITPDDAGAEDGRFRLQALLVKYLRETMYSWEDDFDYEAATVQFESGLNADFWTTAGTSYAAANVTFVAGAGGLLEMKCAAADNDSVNILGLPHILVDENPIFEARFKIDNIATAGCYIGLVEGVFANLSAPDDDVFLIGFDADSPGTPAATALTAISNDANGGVKYVDTGITIENNTFYIVRFDLSNTELPRVWINEAEVAAATITAASMTVQAGTTLMPFAIVQNLTGGAIQRTMTIDYMRCFQDRA